MPRNSEPFDFRKARRQKASLVDHVSADRLPPNSVEGEQGVIGCVLLSPNDSMPVCIDKFATSEVFFDLRHRAIYDCLLEMYDKKEPIDLITVQQTLKDRNQLQEVGGLAYLAGLPDMVPSAANLPYYVEILREKYVLRQMIGTCTEVVSRAYDHQGEVDELIDQVDHDIHAITDRADQRTTVRRARELVNCSVEIIERAYARQGEIDGIATGFIDFDKMTGGLHEGEMIIIAARPGGGKSSMSMNIADHVSVSLHLPVGVFSLEMTGESLMTRAICSRARVNMMNVRDGFLAERDFVRLATAAGQLRHAPLIIDDASGLSIMQLRAKARRLHQQYDIRLLIIDYLQLMHSTNRKADNRQQEVADISSGVKALSKELRIPIIALCQLNRELEKAGRKPRLSDLRESGGLEADADVVGLLYKQKQQGDDDENANTSEQDAIPMVLDIAKQRSGPTGPVHLTFMRSITRFESAARVSDDEVTTDRANPND